MAGLDVAGLSVLIMHHCGLWLCWFIWYVAVGVLLLYANYGHDQLIVLTSVLIYL